MQQCLRKLYKPKVIAFMTVYSVLAAFHFSQQLTKYYGDVTVFTLFLQAHCRFSLCLKAINKITSVFCSGLLSICIQTTIHHTKPIC